MRLVFRLVKVQQGIVGGVGDGDRGFQLMGDVVGEVAFHLFQRLLPQNGADKYPECEDKDNQNDERGSQYARHLLQHQLRDGLYPKTVALVGIEVKGVVVLLGVRAGDISGSTGNGQRVHECVRRVFVARVDMLQTVGQRDAPVFQLKGQQAVVHEDVGVGDNVQTGVQTSLEIGGEFQHAVLVAQNHIQPVFGSQGGLGRVTGIFYGGFQLLLG